MVRLTTVMSAGAVIAGSVWLSGCHTSSPSHEQEEPLALATLAVEQQFVAPGCEGERCSTVRISALEFPQDEALTQQLQERLLTLGMGITEEQAEPAASWEAYAQHFFELAEEGNRLTPPEMTSEAMLEATVHAHHDDLLVLELNSYVYHAGQAHGLPMTAFMVIDERRRAVVEAEDMLLDGQEAAFDRLLAEAHQRWASEMGQDEQFLANWPLSPSRNIAPLEEAWEVKYNVYDIAPYAVGQPTLTIPVEALDGVAKPRFIGAE